MYQIEFIEKCYDRMEQYYSTMEEENKKLKEKLSEQPDQLLELQAFDSQIKELKDKVKEIDKLQSEITKLKSNKAKSPHWPIHLAFFLIVIASIILLFGVKDKFDSTVTIEVFVLVAMLIWAGLVYLMNRTNKDNDEY